MFAYFFVFVFISVVSCTGDLSAATQNKRLPQGADALSSSLPFKGLIKDLKKYISELDVREIVEYLKYG